MTPIQTNKTVFFDKEGLPLNGSIYIGQPGQDPRTNTKTVTFRDSGGVEFTASQTNGLPVLLGRIVYNGKPIVSLVDGNFSMLVFDSAGAQVDYSRSIEPADGSGGASPGTDFTQLIRVGAILADIKLFDVAVGDLVKNVGKLLTSDGLGLNWLVGSATGSPGDDTNLIDFANGLQGAAIVTAIGAGGTAATTAAGARASLAVIENGDGTVTTANLADDSVTSVKIDDGAVTLGKLADDAIANSNVISATLGAEKFQSGTTERDWVLGRNASAAADAVGTYAMGTSSTTKTYGATLAGSFIDATNADASGAGPSLSGTWRCMGRNNGTGASSVTIWLRIS